VHFASYGARDLLEAKKQPKNAFLSGLWMFFRLYVLRGGILDGMAGFHWCFAAGLRSFLKHQIHIQRRNSTNANFEQKR